MSIIFYSILPITLLPYGSFFGQLLKNQVVHYFDGYQARYGLFSRQSERKPYRPGHGQVIVKHAKQKVGLSQYLNRWNISMKKVNICIGSLFGIGFIPFGSGTLASLLSCALILIIKPDRVSLLILLLSILLVSVIVSGEMEKIYGKDSGNIVIDEAIGVLVTLQFIELSLSNVSIGFILFRIFDIFKPLGISRLEGIKGGLGIVLDDVAAGLYSNFILQIITFYK